MNYIVAYDIGDEKRLAKVAKVMTANALRIQKSIFLLQEPSKDELESLKQDLNEAIDKEKDDVRIYEVKNSGFRLGVATDLEQPFIFV